MKRHNVQGCSALPCQRFIPGHGPESSCLEKMFPVPSARHASLPCAPVYSLLTTFHPSLYANRGRLFGYAKAYAEAAEAKDSADSSVSNAKHVIYFLHQRPPKATLAS